MANDPHRDKSGVPIFRYLVTAFTIIAMLSGLPMVNAQDQIIPSDVCLDPADNNTISSNDVLKNLNINSWSRRGDCIRSNSELQCFINLDHVLRDLNYLRAAEYSAAAGLISLLPTIGALLGAPTNEIWQLKTIVPFGGWLAMTLSFGGAILPVSVEDYERGVSKKDRAIGSIVSLRKSFKFDRDLHHSTERKLSLLVDKVRLRLDQRESARLPKLKLWIGLIAMVLLLAAAQGAMGATEQGGIVAWWCRWRFWMHFWYILVTATAALENWSQLPFSTTYKLYVSSIPYEITISGGESITKCFEGEATDNVAVALRQLRTIRAAKLVVHGSQQYTRARNSVMIMVSVVGEGPLAQIWRVLTKSMSIAAYVTGTGIFASVTLLSLKVAVMVVTLTLIAGVFGRAIATWVASSVSDSEPMIHIITSDRQEAYKAIVEVLALRSEDGTMFQTEIQGHVFINERRIAKRSRLWVSVLGVIAEPFDVRKAQHRDPSPAGIASPFLGTEHSSTSVRSMEKTARVQVEPSASRISYSGMTMADGDRIARKPVRSSYENSSSD